jgi:hypothetical protein
MHLLADGYDIQTILELLGRVRKELTGVVRVV